MPTLAEADTSPHYASVMAMDEGPPPEQPQPQQLHKPLTSAPAPLLQPAAAPFPSSSQSNSQRSASTDPTHPKSLNISTTDISSSTTHTHTHNNPPTLNHDDSTASPSSAISSRAASQDTGSTDLLERKPLHVVENLKTEAGHDQQRSLSTSQSPEPTSLSGTKRTATGQLKRSSVNGLGDLVAKASGHTRTSSMVSNGSNNNGNVLEVNNPLNSTTH